MRELKEKKISSAIGVALIFLFSTIYLAIGFYIIDGQLKKYGDDYYRFYIKK